MKSKKRIGFIVLLFSILLCTVLGLGLVQPTTARGANELAAIVPKTKVDIINGVNFVKSQTFEVDKTHYPQSVKVYYALAYNQTDDAEWFKADTISWKKGVVTTEFTQPENISVAFIAFELSAQNPTIAETITFKEIQEKALMTSAVLIQNNFSYDVTAPKIYVEKTDKDGNPKKDYDLSGQRFYVPVKLQFEDPGTSSGYKYLIHKGYLSAEEEIIPHDEIANGLEINPLAAAGLGVRDVTVSIIDAIGNSTTISFKTGFASKDNIKYSQEFRPETGTIAGMVARQQIEYNVDDETMRPIQEILAEYATEYNKLFAEIETFTACVETVKNIAAFKRDEVENLPEFFLTAAQAIKDCDAAYAALTDEEQKVETEVANNKYAEYKKEFDTKRFSHNGFSLQLKNIDEGKKSLEYYQYYLVLEKGVITDKDFLKGINSTLNSNTTFAESYRFKIMLGEKDITEKLNNTDITVMIRLSNSFNPEKGLFPTGGVYENEKFTAKQTRTDLGYTTIDGLILNTDMRILLVLNEPILELWMIIVIVVAGVIVIAGIITLIIVLYKKFSRSPEERLKLLQAEVEKKKRLHDIAKKAKEEEAEINRKHQAEIDKERLEAIERVKLERKKKLQEKESQILTTAQKAEEERKRLELEEYERMALQKVQEAGGKVKPKKAPKEKKPKKSKKPKA